MLLTFGLASVTAMTAQGGAPTFGSVVEIGGSASDIALDESSGLLYIANFGAHVIDVMSTGSNTIQSSINVVPWPGAIALSPDARYLLVAHYCNGQTVPPCENAITSIHLADGFQKVYSLDSPPLGVAFLGSGQALVVTTTNFLLFDPATGQNTLVAAIPNIALTLPVPLATFPGQILQAALASSADGTTIWGIASAGAAAAFVFQYTGGVISAAAYTATPPTLPRVTSSADGSYAMVGYTLLGIRGFPYVKGRYPDIILSTNITGNAIDSAHGIVYAQFPDKNQPAGPATSSSGSAATTPLPAAMLIMDSDNLTFRDRISIPEDMVGRAVLNSAATVLYAVSESGVMVLPVGSLNSAHRVAATQEDLLMATNFCNSGILSQSLTITDPGGGQTAFAVTTTQAGVTILPAAGTTPATVQVLVDPTAIPFSGGTNAIPLTLTSSSAVNQPKPVRLLVNNPDPSQRGTIVDQPGVLSDILPDQARNRVYVLRQDMNQLLVFDENERLIATLRTATSPTMMAMTSDQDYLLVGHNDSQLVTVYNLNTLQPATPILLPGGHYARSIAVSNAAILVFARNEAASPAAGIIDSVDFQAANAAPLPTLGVFENCTSVSTQGSVSPCPPTGVLASSPSGGNILLALPDGTVALYTAAKNTFVNSRQDFTSLSGAIAASDYGSYIVGNSILNSSLVPAGSISPSPLPTSGFTFVGAGGYLASAASASSAGSMLQVVSLPNSGTTTPVTVVEAPLLPVAAGSTGFSTYGTYGSGSTSPYSATSFMRTVAPLTSNGTLVVLSTSGLTVLASDYSAGVVTPAIAAVVSSADGTLPVAPGGLISIYGRNMSQISMAGSGVPLSTALADSCIGVNGTPMPLLYVSPSQINAQLPFNVSGSATLEIHTPGGVSNNFMFNIQPTAPSVFLSGTAGPQTGLATIIRNNNSDLVTPTNPVRGKDSLTIYLTGMGQTTPSIPAGQPAPANPPAATDIQPTVTLGSSNLSVGYAGLAPGEVGVYQINVTVPFNVAGGMAVPLVISQGGASTTLTVRVVN